MKDLSALPDCPAVDDSSQTSPYLPPVFMGARIPAWPAEQPIPPWPVSQADISTLDLKPRKP
jgi:hypothetical protein